MATCATVLVPPQNQPLILSSNNRLLMTKTTMASLKDSKRHMAERQMAQVADTPISSSSPFTSTESWLTLTHFSL